MMQIKTMQINDARLKNCMKRAQKGEALTIGFFGGSITQGCAASVHERCYAYRVFEWWKQAFPKAEFSYVNGGIGGTDSHFGVSRVWQDLLMYQPDVVILDFSVNDMTDDPGRTEEFFKETYEGLVRRILTARTSPALLILNNVCYDTGENIQKAHNQIGDWYGIKHVSMKDTLYAGIQEGTYTQQELTQDGLHPNDRGHELAAAQITALLEETRLSAMDMTKEESEGEIPRPVTANAYENARRLTSREEEPYLFGFHTDTREKTGHLDLFKNGWSGKKPGERILFEETASCIAIQYRKSVAKPALRAKAVLDGDESHAWILDGSFDEDWGDSAQITMILHHGEKKMHRVEIEILDDGLDEETAVPFYLMALIAA